VTLVLLPAWLAGCIPLLLLLLVRTKVSVLVI
jgi:hypothetical protein